MRSAEKQDEGTIVCKLQLLQGNLGEWENDINTTYILLQWNC